MMKKILLVFLLSLCFASCTREQETDTPDMNKKMETLFQGVSQKETDISGYSLVAREFIDKERNIIIQYPEIQGFRGKLLQEYMNQSLAKILKVYGQNEGYSDITIRYEITRMDEDVLSVVYRGKALFSGSRQFSILKSMNLDTGRSSNEINYGNFVLDDAEVRKLIGEKAVKTGIVKFFEAEGISLYFKGDSAVFFYMPPDDMADAFIEVAISLDAIEGYVNWEFGEMPGS